MPSKAYFDRLSSETDFVRDSLEKVYRLLNLVSVISSAPNLGDKLALKGGTALQFIYMDYNRLSVDIDFNYIGSTELAEMQKDRVENRETIIKIFQEYDYEIEKHNDYHSMEQFVLLYTNAVDNRDRLKIDINYSERLPVLSLCSKPMKHPFDDIEDVPVLTYQIEELMAQKTRALLTRGTARDLFDLHQFTQGSKTFDKELYKKLTIFYTCLAAVDVRELTTEKILAITDENIRRNLVSMLRRREYEIDLEAMKTVALSVVGPILDFTPDELQFLDIFYEKKVFEQELLFGGIELDNDLSTHPGVQWRFQN